MESVAKNLTKAQSDALSVYPVNVLSFQTSKMLRTETVFEHAVPQQCFFLLSCNIVNTVCRCCLRKSYCGPDCMLTDNFNSVIVCAHVFIYVHLCAHKCTYLNIRSLMIRGIFICAHMFMFNYVAHICRHMFTYVDI